MPYKANGRRRHKTSKARYRVESWAAYDAALRRLSAKPCSVTIKAKAMIAGFKGKLAMLASAIDLNALGQPPGNRLESLLRLARRNGP